MNIIATISKYVMIVLMALYTFECFTVFRHKSEKKQARIYMRQNVLMFINHFFAYVVLILKSGNIELIFFYGIQVVYFLATIMLFKLFYPKASRLIVNNMVMLISIGFIIIARVNYSLAKKQFIIILGSTIIALLVPVIIRKMKFLKSMTWLYGIAGLVLLLILTIMPQVNGANIELQIAGFSIQPTEFVKIIFVFFIAARLSSSTDFGQVVITTIFAALHVLILVYNTDLGSALIFFIAYLIMLYVATQKYLYLFAGLAAGSGAAVLAYRVFSHVKVRVMAWSDPFAYYQNEGYQIAQSLFAIGTGGWFGLGLYQGAPDTIPYVLEDFVFSAVAEEMGGIYAICLILICMSCFLMFVNISLQIKNQFYKIVALGLGTIYSVQVFLTVGGGIKFIPSTGVTLPLVSYGGSSALSTLIMFAIIQGLYILREDEDGSLERQESNNKGKSKGRQQLREEKQKNKELKKEIGY